MSTASRRDACFALDEDIFIHSSETNSFDAGSNELLAQVSRPKRFSLINFLPIFSPSFFTHRTRVDCRRELFFCVSKIIVGDEKGGSGENMF